MTIAWQVKSNGSNIRPFAMTGREEIRKDPKTCRILFRIESLPYTIMTMTFVIKSQLSSMSNLAARSAAAAGRISAAKRTMAAAPAAAASTDLVKTSLYDLHKGTHGRKDIGWKRR
jgi:hypothetical protein